MLGEGYYWATTPEGEFFIVMNAGGKWFVPGVECDISSEQFTITEPVKWPAPVASQVSDLPRRGVRAPAAATGCVILPFAASA